ncbi:hypothetical protein AX14_005521 [Amanita brunnescens Koide BX004]|nr:hypothetical protein AX14_005521 [Amanita brunnescens Koide BX004]
MAGRWLANGRWTKNVKSAKKLRDPEKPNPAFRFQPRPTPHPPFQVLMNSNHIQTLPAQNHMSFNRARYLPTYEECNAPYSLRLPSYRSSHVRRFHPYARYAATFQEDYIDDCDHGDGEALLDLSILNTPTLHMITESAPNGDLAQRNQENRVEEHRNGPGEIASESVIINLDMINRHLNVQADEEENIERSRQSSHFLRMDVAECFQSL